MSNRKKINGEWYIRRKGYVRKAHARKSFVRNGTKINSTTVKKTVVPSTWIKDLGLPGKTPKSKQVIPKLERGKMSQFGYTTKKSATDRHQALIRMAKKKSYSTTVKDLVARRTLTKNTLPKTSSIYDKDYQWLSKHKSLIQ
jgi:hypothetical protein